MNSSLGELGQWQQQLPQQQMPPKPGENYVKSWNPAKGQYVWRECPYIPPVPSISATPQGIANLRNWYDAVFMAEASAFQGWNLCPAYTQINPRKWGVDTAVKRAFPAAQIPQLLGPIFSAIIPGQFDIISGAAFGRIGQGTAMVPGQWGGSSAAYRAPSRPNAAGVADRISALNYAVSLIGVSTLRRWPSFIEGLKNWFQNTTISSAQIRLWGKNLSFLVKAWKRVPWPHPFFASFMNRPTMNVPATFGGYRYNDPDIAKSGYFPRTIDDIEIGIAVYIEQNTGLLEQHFANEFNAYIKELEEEAKRLAKQAKKLQIVVSVLGLVIGLISAGILVSVVSAVAQSAVQVYSVRKLTAQQVQAMERIMKVLGITRVGLENFRLWLAAKSQRAAEAPPTPVDTDKKFSAFVDGELVANEDDMKDSLSTAFMRSDIGNRITIKDEETGKAVAVFIREEEGLRHVPANVAAKAQALPASSAEKVAGKKEFPWAAALPIAFMVLR